MATKSFLNIEQIEEALKVLNAPSLPPDGDEKKLDDIRSSDFSVWLGEKLLERLSRHSEWLICEPVIVGSWARGELCPKSDIDIIFCGPEERVKNLVQDFSKEGLKLRYRVPEDPSDWTKGVEPFDILALFSAVPIGALAESKLKIQLDKLSKRTLEFRRQLLKAMSVERKARAERYDSISNFLEPNLKYGKGGLRDLEQALVTAELFPEKFIGRRHAFDVLRYYKRFFLLVRQKLHLAGGGEILSAPEQRPISDWLGFRDNKDFMREIQKGVSRVSFYADWVVAQALASKAVIKKVNDFHLIKAESLFKALEEDPSILMQNRIRLASDDIFNGLKFKPDEKKATEKVIGKYLTRFLDPAEKEGSMVALFRARLIDHCVPEFRRIVGHVQHDQYHRFSVDAHILQALRELKRIRQKPGIAGRLAPWVKGLSKKEWEILSFSCLYHDIAKGRSGDHAINGIGIAKEDLERFGKDESLVREVCWIVEEHLALSAAAFRENPSSPRTWRMLAEKGVIGRRLALLAVFTVVDIRATNPEAWTPWKERLLHELLVQLEKPEAGSLNQLAEKLKEAGIQGWEAKIESLDPFLVGSLSPKTLVQDFKVLLAPQLTNGKLETDADLPPAVVKVRGGKQTWIRFHSREDRPGLFLQYVRQLARSGLGVRHASIHTDPSFGVYDWFEVKTSKTPAQIVKLLSVPVPLREQERLPSVRFDSIELVSFDENEWVISFKGRDQTGALAAAAEALFESGAAVRWAKVHTWGRQIDDVFGVAPLRASQEGANDLIKRLSLRLVEPDSGADSGSGKISSAKV